jgi:hypothetical protein
MGSSTFPPQKAAPCARGSSWTVAPPGLTLSRQLAAVVDGIDAADGDELDNADADVD